MDRRYKTLVYGNRKRAEKFGLTEHFSEQEWFTMIEFSGNKCVSCKRDIDKIFVTADHVIPLTKGGPNTIDNIQVLCRSCNSIKRDRVIDYRDFDVSDTITHDESVNVEVQPPDKR